jgi:hypothetical protein
MDGVDSIREELSGDIIHFNKLDDNTGIFAEVDAFVNLSRENESVEYVTLCPATDPDAHRYAIWDKIAEGIGNLQALCAIIIVDTDLVVGEEEALAPDWEILACFLRRLRRGIHLYMQDGTILLWDTETLPAFGRAIHGQAMIRGFSTGGGFHFNCLDILCSTLLTLPALTNVTFEHYDDEGPEEGQSLESMVKLLQSPSLRTVKFESVVFTSTLSQAVAKALKERSEITDLRFWMCSFPEGGSAVIASALETNTTLKCLNFYDHATDEVLYEVLAAALLSNSTLQKLAFDASGRCSWLSPLFLALQVNNGLKELSIGGINLLDEKLSSAMRIGLSKNSTLELLELSSIKSGNKNASLWREALSFLPTNRALKRLYMQFEQNVKKAHAGAIRMEVLAALRENESLQSLSMISDDARFDARFEDLLAFIAAIHPNTTLKSFWLDNVPFCVEGDKRKDLISILKKNYGLEEIRDLPRHDSEDIRSIFELNRAGRRYLVQDGSSISKGVDVLSRVSSNVNSVFLHLLENPRLCDRGAVEMSSSSIANMDSARSSPVASGNRHNGEKREQQAPSQTDKETRRRLE